MKLELTKRFLKKLINFKGITSLLTDLSMIKKSMVQQIGGKIWTSLSHAAKNPQPGEKIIPFRYFNVKCLELWKGLFS